MSLPGLTEVAACVAAIAGLLNLWLAYAREKSSLKVFAYEWAADRRGDERYFSVVVTNAGRRPCTVVTIGLKLKSATRTQSLDDGKLASPLPAKIEDGEAMTMTWYRDELGEEFANQDASIVECFAVDSRGKRVSGSAPVML